MFNNNDAQELNLFSVWSVYQIITLLLMAVILVPQTSPLTIGTVILAVLFPVALEFCHAVL